MLNICIAKLQAFLFMGPKSLAQVSSLQIKMFSAQWVHVLLIDGVLLQLRVPGMKNSTCFSRSLLRKCLYSLENGVSFTSIPGYTLGSFLVTTVCLSHQRHCLLHKRPRWLMSNTFLLAVGSSEEYRGTGRDRPRSRAARVLVLPSPEQSGGSRCRVEEGHE